MSIIFKSGNVLDASENIICQQVNCRGVMGAGLAKQIRNKYPEVYDQYAEYCRKRPSSNLLGTFLPIYVSDGKIIANLFGQNNYGTKPERYIHYTSLITAFRGLAKFALLDNKSIAIPYGLGCGLAGGNWNAVFSIIEETLDNKDLCVAIYKL
jgi:O-acetyl-ADP-ribose deacetylase (regulator of RNase III)